MATTLTEKATAIRQSLLTQALLKSSNHLSNHSFYLSRQTNLAEEIATDIEIHQSPEGRNPKWSHEDQALIDWVIANFHTISMPIMGKPAWRKIQQTLALGPNGPSALSREFQNSLNFLRQIIEKENEKRNHNQT